MHDAVFPGLAVNDICYAVLHPQNTPHVFVIVKGIVKDVFDFGQNKVYYHLSFINFIETEHRLKSLLHNAQFRMVNLSTSKIEYPQFVVDLNASLTVAQQFQYQLSDYRFDVRSISVTHTINDALLLINTLNVSIYKQLAQMLNEVNIHVDNSSLILLDTI